MMVELIAFLIILLIDVISFTSIFYFLFRTKITDFDTYFHTITNLIGYSLGGFSFTILEDDKFSEVLSTIIIIKFLFINCQKR